MKAKTIFILLLVHSMVFIPHYAQDETNPQILHSLLEEGDKMYSKANYEKAIELYQEVAEKIKDDPYINKRIGVTLSI